MACSITILLSDLSPGSCLFCHDESSLRSMHRTYYHNGESENYTTMLLLCFDMKVSGLGVKDRTSEICETCVERLRDAFLFRKLIEAADETFHDKLALDIHKTTIKLDNSIESNENQDEADETFDNDTFLDDTVADDIEEDTILKDILKKTCKRRCPRKTITKGKKSTNKRKKMEFDLSDEDIARMFSKKRKRGLEDIDNQPPPLDPIATQCPICKEKFNVPRVLARHYATHFPNYICDVCGKAWLKKQNLDMHVKTHYSQKVVCDVCNKTYANRSAMLQHKRIKHRGEKVYSCKFCEMKFSDNSYRNKHLSDVHGEPVRKYPCPTCDKVYFRSARLWVHLKRDHHQQRNYSCTLCESQFFSKNGLNNHMLRHTGERRFRCEVCGKAYGRKNTLVEHMKIHADIRAYKCDECGKAFIQKCTLKTHISSQHPNKNSQITQD